MDPLTLSEQLAILKDLVEGGFLEFRADSGMPGDLALYITDKGRKVLDGMFDYDEDNWLLQKIVNL